MSTFVAGCMFWADFWSSPGTIFCWISITMDWIVFVIIFGSGLVFATATVAGGRDEWRKFNGVTIFVFGWAVFRGFGFYFSVSFYLGFSVTFFLFISVDFRLGFVLGWPPRARGANFILLLNLIIFRYLIVVYVFLVLLFLWVVGCFFVGEVVFYCLGVACESEAFCVLFFEFVFRFECFCVGVICPEVVVCVGF